MKRVKYVIAGEFETELPDNMPEGAVNDMLMKHPEKLAGSIDDVKVTITDILEENVIKVAVGPNGKLQKV